MSPEYSPEVANDVVLLDSKPRPITCPWFTVKLSPVAVTPLFCEISQEIDVSEVSELPSVALRMPKSSVTVS